MVAGGVVGVLGLLPGMPNVAFLTLAAITVGGGYWFEKRARHKPLPASETKPAEPAAPAQPQAEKELGWDDVSPVDLIGLEVGYRLIPLVDRNQSGPLLGRIKAVRRKLSEELGFLIQAVHIRDNLELKPNAYRIAVLGVPVGEGEIHSERDLAINPGGVTAQIVGIKTKDPAFGLDAYWIEPAGKEHALSLGYTVVDAATVVATHLSELLKRHAHQLLGHEEVQQLLDRLAKSAPKLVENLTPGALTLGVVVKVMQDLLVDRVPVRNIRTIAETLAENAARSQDPAVLLAHVREALGSSIVQGIYGLRDELPVITLDPTLEQMLREGLKSGADAGPSFEPGLADRLHGALADAAQQQELRSEPAVLLVPTVLRPWLARFTRHGLPNLAVLAYGEIPTTKSLRVVASVGSAAGANARAATRAA
jgi:flagellar biosynthesis protein FlhA